KACNINLTYMEDLEEGSRIKVEEGIITGASQFMPSWGVSWAQRQKSVKATGGAPTPKFGVQDQEDLPPMPEHKVIGKTDDIPPMPTNRRYIPTGLLGTGVIQTETTQAFETRQPRRIADIDAWIDWAATA